MNSNLNHRRSQLLPDEAPNNSINPTTTNTTIDGESDHRRLLRILETANLEDEDLASLLVRYLSIPNYLLWLELISNDSTNARLNILNRRERRSYNADDIPSPSDHDISYDDRSEEINMIYWNDRDMSYEEMLALDDRIGLVNRGLTERQIVECLETHTCRTFDFDEICSICQDEYVVGEELSNLVCDHMFHLQCITEWLRRRNSCPLCKTCASS